MSTIKKLIGFFSLIIGPILLAGLVYRAIHEFAIAKPEQLSELYVFWPVILIIFIPIAIGFSIFGWYSVKGLYNQLPVRSSEIE
jgi:hypothetical protein